MLQLSISILSSISFTNLLMKKQTSISAELGITHQDMAMLLGVSRSLWSLYETGKRELPTAALLKLSELQRHISADAAKITQPVLLDRTRKVFEDLLKETEHRLYMLERKIAATEKKERAQTNLVHFSKILTDREHSKSGALATDAIAAKATLAERSKMSETLLLLQHRKEVLELEKKLLKSKLK